MSFEHLEYAGNTDVGKQREGNEDAFVCLADQGLFCVADGIGGAEAGAQASQALVDGLAENFKDLSENIFSSSLARSRLLKSIVNDVSKKIKTMADAMGYSGTGTTASLLVFDALHKDSAEILHAGDSSVYLYRHDSLNRLNRLHSLSESKVFKTSGPLPAFMRGMITRAVGVHDTVELEETIVDVLPGDLYMICSDGLDGMLSHDDLHRLLHDYRDDPLEEQVRVLIDAANENGGRDNITVILVRAGKPLKERHGQSDA